MLKSQQPSGVTLCKGVLRIAVAVTVAGSMSSISRTSPQTNWKPDPGTPADRLMPVKGEITADKAVESCERFFRQCFMPVPRDLPTVSRRNLRGGRSAVYGIRYGGEARLSVNAKTGVIVLFTNTQRHLDRRAGRTAPGRPLLTDSINAQIHVVKLAKRIGLAKDCKLLDFSCYLKGDPSDLESNHSPTIRATFQQPDGYRLHEAWGRFEVIVDPSDGAVIDLAQWPERPYAIETRVATVTRHEAGDRARRTAQAYRIGRAPSGVLVTPKLELMYVYPNGELGGVQPKRAKTTAHVRLAWVAVYPSTEEIWIDAVDARVLGGIWIGSRRVKQAEGV